MSSSDPEYGRKGLDMSLAQRRYEWIAAPQEYVLCGGLEFQRCPGPPWIEAHGAGSTVCPTVGHAAASLLSALQWYIDSDDEFEIQVRSVDNDPTPTPTAVTDNDDDTPARAAPRFPPIIFRARAAHELRDGSQILHTRRTTGSKPCIAKPASGGEVPSQMPSSRSRWPEVMMRRSNGN